MIGSELVRLGVLPCDFILDVGCGTGEFISSLGNSRVGGIDVVDIRVRDDFEFELVSFEDYSGDPDVLLFKQSYHLLSDPDSVSVRFPRSTLVLAQMPRPEWGCDSWSERPLSAEQNALYLKNLGREVSLVRLEQNHEIPLDFLKRMILEGYTSDLRSLPYSSRVIIWESMRKERFFRDVLDLVVAVP